MKSATQDICMAIDMGGTKTLVGLIRSDGVILNRRKFATDVSRSPEEHLERCIVALQECLSESGLSDRDTTGIGVTVPGLADPHRGMLVYAPYSGWKEVQVRDLLRRAWPEHSIEVANDVNACALAEMLFGKTKHLSNFVWVTVSTGIGAGLIINRQIVEGERLIAGELGHVVVEWESGHLCGCGNRGCLEAQASGKAIEHEAKQIVLTEGNESELARYFQLKRIEITAETVANAAREGIQTAIDIYERTGRYIGRALSYAANLLNPGAFIIGGGVSLSFELLRKGIDATFAAAVIGVSNKQVPIMNTGLGYEAGLMGAASLVFLKTISR